MYAVVKIIAVKHLNYEPIDWIRREGEICEKSHVLITEDHGQATSCAKQRNLLDENGAEYYVADIN